MTKQELKAMKKHYREWSGGFSPESEYVIMDYLDYALSVELVREEAEDALWEWMNDT